MNSGIEVEVYKTGNGKSPFVTWQAKLSPRARDIVLARLSRLRLGHYGDAKVLKGVPRIYELRIHESPGYRIYFGKRGNTLVVLLCGGAKSNQKKDIERARRYWEDYIQYGKK